MKRLVSNMLINKILRDEESKKRGERIKVISIVDNTVIFKWSEYVEDSINIYELMAKAKEWLYQNRNSVRITSTKNAIGTWDIQIDAGDVREFTADTEEEAVFKACQHIIDLDGRGL